MRAQIEKDGTLRINRRGKLVQAKCPFRFPICNHSCPMFFERALKKELHLFLVCSGESVVFYPVEDKRE